MADGIERRLTLVRPASSQPIEAPDSPAARPGLRVLTGQAAAGFFSERSTVVALGVFDGVHQGHADLISRAVRAARGRNAEAVVFTFDPHPALVLGRAGMPGYLTTVNEKAAILESLGVDTLLVQPFDRAVAGEAPEDFVHLRLSGALRVAEVVVGFNFTFGRGGAGNPAILRQLGAEHEFTTTVMPPVMLRGTIVSSTAIRQSLLDGDIETANRLLGREYAITGLILRSPGRARAKTAARTVEVSTPRGRLLPKSGAYSGWAGLSGSGEGWPAVATVRNEATPDGIEQRLTVFSANAGVAWFGHTITFRFGVRLF